MAAGVPYKLGDATPSSAWASDIASAMFSSNYFHGAGLRNMTAEERHAVWGAGMQNAIPQAPQGRDFMAEAWAEVNAMCPSDD
jgi:hypothetical protein